MLALLLAIFVAFPTPMVIPLSEGGRSDHYSITACVGNIANCTSMLVDTGSQVTMLDPQALWALEKKHQAIQVATGQLITADGAVTSFPVYRIKDFWVGAVVADSPTCRLRDVEVVAGPANIIGVDVLGRLAKGVELDDNGLHIACPANGG